MEIQGPKIAHKPVQYARLALIATFLAFTLHYPACYSYHVLEYPFFYP